MKKKKHIWPVSISDTFLAHTDKLETIMSNFAAALPKNLLIEFQAMVDNVKTQNAQFEAILSEGPTLSEAVEIIKAGGSAIQLEDIYSELNSDEQKYLHESICEGIVIEPQTQWQRERIEALVYEIMPACNDQSAYVMGL